MVILAQVFYQTQVQAPRLLRRGQILFCAGKTKSGVVTLAQVVYQTQIQNSPPAKEGTDFVLRRQNEIRGGDTRTSSLLNTSTSSPPAKEGTDFVLRRQNEIRGGKARAGSLPPPPTGTPPYQGGELCLLCITLLTLFLYL
ncbi:hypothetical protein CAP35_02760 [Chitinophagaceae bacterium IBVUCB1]|nr:hypothetical protein CAP35_02760 [Chitinophagaceae bacterium IBVUCB1]